MLFILHPPYNTGGKDFKYDDTFIDEKDGLDIVSGLRSCMKD